MQALIGLKKVQSQRFLENGRRIPVTLIDVKDNRVISVKTQERDNYQAVQLGFSMKKKGSKAELGHAKGANLEKAPKFLKEVRVYDDSPLPEVGSIVNPAEVFQPGDIVNVTGLSKGKGFQGGVRRHHFKGGPKTHGQSDRHRAPGAIGQGTTPGRVYKGKRMAGRMGDEIVTVANLEIIDVTNDGVLVVKGLVPGVINSLITIKKVGEDKKFVPLYKDPEEIKAEEQVKEEVESEEKIDEAPSEDAKEEISAEAKEENVEVAQEAEEVKTEEVSDEVKEENPSENNEEVAADAQSSGEPQKEENAK